MRDRPSLEAWLAPILLHGSGRLDGMLLAAAWRAFDTNELDEVLDLAAALRGTAELAHETSAQGEAFLAGMRAAWPGADLPETMVLPCAVGLAGAAHGIALEIMLPLYLQAFAANLVSAAVRLVPLGQTDGLRAIAALEPVVIEAAAAALAADPDDLGTATPMLDWTSMMHETQYTRLFRS